MFGPTQEEIVNFTPKSRKKKCYAFLTLFDHSDNELRPFGWFPHSMFTKKEIKDSWLDSVLDDASRMKPLTLERIKDQKFSLFGKMEEGGIMKIIIFVRRY